ncbi:unnamed protein product [Schistosoma intercalatum]|nr:unnamed protein product [Schistosoma intercalatum]
MTTLRKLFLEIKLLVQYVYLSNETTQRIVSKSYQQWNSTSFSVYCRLRTSTFCHLIPSSRNAIRKLSNSKHKKQLWK